MKALILFSHGSLLCGAGEALEAHATRLRARGNYNRVEIGYLNYTNPLFPDTVERLVQAGATEIIVVPYFLVPGYFVTKSLPDLLATVQQVHPGVTFMVAEALGTDDILADVLLEAALSARSEAHWRDPLKRASLSCRASSECPLYGTPACPKVPFLASSEKELADV